jgi:hypothetical protein
MMTQNTIEWINDCLTISAHPSKIELKEKWWQDYDLIINVSDYIDFKRHSEIAKKGVPIFWFPIGESYGMPLENIYGALSVIWNAETNALKVFMHCMAGRNRSMLIADCYYFMMQGEHRSDNSSDVLYGKNKSNKLLLNVNDNQLPGIFRMEVFLERCRELFENPNIAGDANADWMKKETFGY